MSMRIGSRGIARALNTLSSAGPMTNSAIAAGAVTRLRRAARWSEPYVESLSGLPEAAKIAASPVLVLDRHSFALHTACTLDEIAPIYELRELRDRAITIRALSRRATGLWDPRVKARVLIAPNVLAAAHAHSLDQSDWCKWVALRVGLEGLIVHKAPNLVDPTLENTDFLARLLLVDALLDALMLRLTPADLSSVLWIRNFGPKSSIRTLVSALLLDSSVPQTELFRAYEDYRRISQEIVSSNSLGPALDALSRNEDPFPYFARKGPEATTAPTPTSPRVC
ncbi:hypothetical protein [Schaalia cardiffensis]|uniref:hypothetical protein n=1 Tax=Schaalia cardiffensis TaxID=181487 RepID=UPI0023F3C4B5|nr:hypothetical protein [Schaalia cardiffensis]